ncbi:hypothetical protein GCM10010123_36950 [Pilimelia anulata]|uniref:Carrier domain-containing protein n=1 Tax=Pilimelia anulata TaxID=53371 RepID=A0A8J3BHD6_9ACTN|nr:non-ribosomal peptide synthetase [Pilimelia anulata]GGK03630.1 hypothetical protein GCM10010123_36950 [Pilimelia anulata]
MTDLSARLGTLTPAQRALLDARLAGRAPGPAAPIPRRPDRDRGRLTLDQERLWLIHRLDPADPAYHVFSCSRLRGRLDRAALGRAARAVAARHEVLRSTFPAGPDARPVQVVHPDAAVDVRLVDLTGEPAAGREEAMRRAVDAEIRRPFDLATDRPLRLALVALGDAEHVLVGTFHHLVWDRASMGIFSAELAGFYGAYAGGPAHSPPGLPIQYADYAAWQPGWIEREVRRRHLPYWRDKLAGAPRTLDLPTDHPRPAVRRARGSRHEFRMSAELTAAVRGYARAANVTLNVALLAAWAYLLHRLAGTDDVVVGTTSSTRTRPGTEALIGYFLTMLPLRIAVPAAGSFADLVRSTRATMLGALDHHDTPLGLLLDELGGDRDPSRHPLYQVGFILVDFRHERPAPLPGLDVEPLRFDNGTVKDDLCLGVFDDKQTGDRLWGMIEYNSDLFAAGTVARLWRQLEHLLAAAVADPDRPLADLPLLSPADRAHLLAAGTAPPPATRPVTESVRERAAADPSALAVVAGDGRRTYGELLGRAAAVAAGLRARGVGADDVVAVCADRVADLPADLLGVLLAGAAYLPLDPALPAARLAAMVDRSGAVLALAPPERASLLAGSAAPVLDPAAVLADRPAAAAARTAAAATPRPDGRAFVVYTSGSTGRPKGVEVTHRGLAAVVAAMGDRLALTAADRVASVASISFDIFGLDLFGALTAGAALVLVDPAVAADARRLGPALDDAGATVLQSTPATTRLLLDAGWRNPRGIRLCSGGEALPAGQAAALTALPGPLCNAYGPTETTIYSTADRVAPGGPVTIGGPLPGSRAYVLDARLRPVPVGVPGELYLGGAGLARGYRGDPAGTAARFVADHLGGAPGARLYRTGDVVRWRDDGRLVFVGRNDDQVKVRGYRVEPAEVEAALDRHPAVRRSVVTVREDRPGDRRLVAHLVCAGAPPADADLRAHLRATLPAYLVPAAFVPIDAVPLTPTGKLDRRALPAPPVRPAAGRVAPRDAVEARVAAVWERVLDVRPVGVRDAFFDLGGHSLLVLRLMAAIEAEFGVGLPLSAIFRGATVESFARLLRDPYPDDLLGDADPAGAGARDGIPTTARPAGVDGGSAGLVRLRGGVGPAVFFAHAAGDDVTCYAACAAALRADRPAYALVPPPGVAYPTLAARAAAHAALIRRAQPDGPYAVVGWSHGGAHAHAAAAALERGGARTRLVLLDAQPPERIRADGPPTRAAVVALLAAHLAGGPPPDPGPAGSDAAADIAYLAGLAGVDPGRMAAVVAGWTVNLGLLHAHAPEPIAGPVTLVRAAGADPARFAEWERLTTGGLTRHAVAADHHGMLRPPHAGTVAAIIDAAAGAVTPGPTAAGSGS